MIRRLVKGVIIHFAQARVMMVPVRTPLHPNTGPSHIVHYTLLTEQPGNIIQSEIYCYIIGERDETNDIIFPCGTSMGKMKRTKVRLLRVLHVYAVNF